MCSFPPPALLKKNPEFSDTLPVRTDFPYVFDVEEPKNEFPGVYNPNAEKPY